MHLKYENRVFGEPLQLLDPPNSRLMWQTLGPAWRISSGNVYRLSFFPSVDGIQKIRSSDMAFPEECCVCSEPSTCMLPIRPRSWMRYLLERFGWKEPLSIPHCKKHSNRRYAVFCGGFYLIGSPEVRCYCLGLNQQFLEKIRDSYSEGECQPPWEFAPRHHCDSGWHLSTVEENWVGNYWRPFWTSLNEIERLEYLKRWNADETWRASFLNKDGAWHRRSDEKYWTADSK